VVVDPGFSTLQEYLDAASANFNLRYPLLNIDPSIFSGSPWVVAKIPTNYLVLPGRVVKLPYPGYAKILQKYRFPTKLYSIFSRNK